MLEVVVLAAGKGTRMRSQKPKVMHPIAGKPMLEHVLHTAHTLEPQALYVVVGHGAELIQTQVQTACEWVYQAEQLGTAHAVQQVLPKLHTETITLILYGDVPLIQSATLKILINLAHAGHLAMLSAELINPTGYGRVVRDAQGQVMAVVEQKDATAAQQTISEVNTGIMAIPTAYLKELLPLVSNQNAQHEFYLTDIIQLATARGISVIAHPTTHIYEIQGINNRQQQAQLEREFQRLQAERLLAQGLTLLDPHRFDCRGTLEFGADCQIDINCVFEGGVKLGDHVSVGPNCMIKNSVIGDGVEILANTVIEDALIGHHCHIGPFARVRPGSEFADAVRIGNFVEIKKSNIGAGSKVNHLSYIGDAKIGKKVNIGAGTITCNYDGVNKFNTHIEDDVFVGSNSALVAPVHLGQNVTVAAGSVITQDVEPNQLAVARQRQKNIDGWKRPQKTEKDKT